MYLDCVDYPKTVTLVTRITRLCSRIPKLFLIVKLVCMMSESYIVAGLPTDVCPEIDERLTFFFIIWAYFFDFLIFYCALTERSPVS